MKKNLWVVASICIGCNQKVKNTTNLFIVPVDKLPVFESKVPDAPPPPPTIGVYYLPFNFIIDTGEQIFFYQQQLRMFDDEMKSWNTPPDFINLQPNEIVQIPANSIEDFINLNILNMPDLKRLVAIASTKDTINSVGLSKIIAIFKTYHVLCKFRIATLEEKVVLDYKKKQVSYYPGEIKWDSTKIRFR